MPIRTALVVVAVLLVSAVAAAQPKAAVMPPPSTHAPRVVVVSGHGEAAARPDQTSIMVGVESQASTAAAALADNNKKMAALIAAVKQAGVADKDVRTTSFQVFPYYTESKTNPQQAVLAGYRVVNEVTVRSKNVAGLGALLDKLVSVGANQIRGVTFEIADDTALKVDARKRAMEDAEKRARQLAELAGASLGPVHDVRETQGGVGPLPHTRMMMAEAKQSVPMEAGESVVAVDVEAAWTLR